MSSTKALKTSSGCASDQNGMLKQTNKQKENLVLW